MTNRTNGFGDAHKNNKEFWAEIPSGTRVFDVVSKDGKEVRVGTIVDDRKTSGDFIGYLVEGFRERRTNPIHIKPRVIRDAIAHQHYVILDRSPRFVLPL